MLEQRNQGFKEVMKKERPGVNFLVFDAKQSPTDNFNTWSAQVKAHPDALAYVGPGSQAAVSLSRIQKRTAARSCSSAPATSTRSRSGRQATGYVKALISPEHWLKGYLAIKLMATPSRRTRTLPEGVWNSGALTVNKDNIDEIITRQKARRPARSTSRTRSTSSSPTPTSYLSARRRLVLEARDVRKTYGGVVALAGADFTVRAGSVHALLGENGAGKSTLVKVIAGAIAPDAGSVRLDGEQVRFATTAEAVRRGVAVVSQELNVFPRPRRARRTCSRCARSRRGPFISRRAMAARARPVLAELGLDVGLRTPVEELPPRAAPAGRDRQGAADRAARC